MKKLGNTSSNVMEQHAPAVVEADDPMRALYRKLDFYPTPPWGARAGAQILKRFDARPLTVCDPACGEGHIIYPISEILGSALITGSDIYDYGKGFAVRDFLGGVHENEFDWGFANPPFEHIADFVRQMLYAARRGVAVFARLGFLCSADRYALNYTDKNCLTQCCPFVERIALTLGEWKPDASTATEYAWFFFVKNHKSLPISPIPPGTKDRLWRADDVRNFAKAGPAPLLEYAGVDPQPPQRTEFLPSPAHTNGERTAGGHAAPHAPEAARCISTDASRAGDGGAVCAAALGEMA